MFTTISRKKRRKISTGQALSTGSEDYKPHLSFEPLLQLIGNSGTHQNDETSFDSFMDVLLPNYLAKRAKLQDQESERDEHGNIIRPLTRFEISSFIQDLESSPALSTAEVITLRKLKLQRERRRARLAETVISPLSSTITSLPPFRPTPSPNPQVLDALYAIGTTPYEHSFLSRLYGVSPDRASGLVAIDWETQAPWMDLMGDIRAHHSLAHPERDQAEETVAPIAYVSLQSCHLVQVHDLLARVFWTGIDVSDSLHHSPERCTIIATYKKLVVGAAFLSSPQEAYITYLAVRAGWDNSQIASSMLYHLITLNPNKDITLHVSANNPAMILYNRFGFKAEEFIAGFYEDYLDPQSRASKNAFRLRLRR